MAMIAVTGSDQIKNLGFMFVIIPGYYFIILLNFFK
jgi:hypothetical protein